MATSNTTPVVIPQPIAAQATSENINVIPNGATGTNGASFQEGFPAITRMPVIENPLPTQVSGLPPKQQDFNGLFNVVSQHNFFAQNGGTYSFNQAVSDAIGGYAKNQILWYFPTNGLPVPVLSMIDNNTYNFAENPSYIDGEKWSYIVADTSLTNSPYTTNRILEIPQDIKLELNDGTLTLKAGSKVYVPNGFEADGTTPKFDVVTISVDKTGLAWINTNIIDYIIFYTIVGNIDATRSERCTSGTSYPSSPSNGDRCYRTDLNRLYVYRKSSSSWAEEDSLPLGIIRSSGTDGKIGSIEQVFNGFGYIGSTVFALPGVKVQIPNGRNEDGTYKSFIYTVSSVLTCNTFNSGTINGKAVIAPEMENVLDRESLELKFDSNTGYMSRDIHRKSCIIANVSWTTSGINSFEPYSVDSVLNSNLSNLSAVGQNVILNLAAQRGNQTGTIIIWSAPTPPDGYLICNGAAVSRTTYAALFNVIGTTWGAGDGNTTFNLPNMLDYGPWYSTRPVGQYSKGGVPNITGTIGSINSHGFVANGVFGQEGNGYVTNPGGGTGDWRNVSFNASRSSSVYTNYDRVVPANATCLFCIKY